MKYIFSKIEKKNVDIAVATSRLFSEDIGKNPPAICDALAIGGQGSNFEERYFVLEALHPFKLDNWKAML